MGKVQQTLTSYYYPGSIIMLGAASQVLRRNGEMNGIEGEAQFISQTVPTLLVRTWL